MIKSWITNNLNALILTGLTACIGMLINLTVDNSMNKLRMQYIEDKQRVHDEALQKQQNINVEQIEHNYEKDQKDKEQDRLILIIANKNGLLKDDIELKKTADNQ